MKQSNFHSFHDEIDCFAVLAMTGGGFAELGQTVSC